MSSRLTDFTQLVQLLLCISPVFYVMRWVLIFAGHSSDLYWGLFFLSRDRRFIIPWALGKVFEIAAVNVRWGNTVLGFIAVVLIPIPFLLYRYEVVQQYMLTIDTANGFEQGIRLNSISMKWELEVNQIVRLADIFRPVG